MLNLISSVLQQECKQESVNVDKGRITGSAPPRKNSPFPPNGGRSHAFAFLDLGRSVLFVIPRYDEVSSTCERALHANDF